MINIFKQHIENNFKELFNAPFLIAISGGVDSVVLSHLCVSCNLNFGLAHCNFQLRNTESDADEAFVKHLAKECKAELFVKRFNTKQYADVHKRSIQMAAREQRYQWFQELINTTHYKYILTAHHTNDNLETFLINFIRGTGLNGLTGIPEKQKHIRRPLLPFSSEEILNYAKENRITWREDSSNKTVKYLRNKLRHEVIPILQEINPELIDTYKQNNHFLNDSAYLVKQEIKGFIKKAVLDKKDRIVSFKVNAFLKTKNPRAYLYEVFKSYGFTQWNDILHLLTAESGKQVFSKSHRIIKYKNTLLLAPKKTEQASFFSITKETKTIKIPEGEITFKTVKKNKHNSKHCIYLDKANIQFPLEIRSWNTQDVIYLSGMNGKKKVSKLLKDEKLSPIEKENTLVLISNNKVVWVIGIRVDKRFLATSTSQVLFKVKLSKP